MDSTSVFNVTNLDMKMIEEVNRTDHGTKLNSHLSFSTSRNNTTLDSTNWFAKNSLNSVCLDKCNTPASETETEIDVSNEMYNSYMKIASQTNQYNLLSSINDYLKECQRVCESIHNKLNSSSFYPNKAQKMEESLKLLKLETDTWMLLQVLLKERLIEKSGVLEELLQSERELSDALFENNLEMRQAQLIIDWLEHMVRSSNDNQQKLKLTFFNQNHGARENSLLYLKEHGETHRNIVTSMDPDAQTRQESKLMGLDEEDDRNLLKYIFYCIRSGQFNKACNTCEKSGQIWRALSLQGWKLFHDDNSRCLGEGGVVKKTDGNEFRWLWRHVCSQIIADKKVTLAEKAVLGCLVGHLPSILTHCSTWHDHVWAYLKVLVDQKVQEHLMQNANILNYFYLHNDDKIDEDDQILYIGDKGYGEKNLKKDVDTYYQANTTQILNFEDMFGKIESSTNEELRQQSHSRFFIIQKFIILNQPDRLLEYMSLWCDNDINPHLLRMTTHLCLLFNSISPLCNFEQKEKLLVCWVNHLIASSHHSLVAFYTAQLPSSTQTSIYASMLRDVKDTTSRKECLRWADEAGLDVKAIILLIVEISTKVTDLNVNINECEKTNEDLTEEDLVKIGSVEWLTFDSTCVLMLFTHTNYMLRIFMLSRKTEACRRLVLSLPTNSMETLLVQTKKSDESYQKHVDNVVGEFTCFTMYLSAMDTFADWFEHFYQSKPHKPQESAITSDFAEKVSFEHSLKQYNKDINIWKQISNSLAEKAVSALKGVVTFNSGGWLVDLYEDDNHTRNQHMNIIRRMYIPSIFHVIIKIFSSLQRWSDCTSIVEIIASQDYRLFEVLSEDEMERILLELTSCIVKRIKSEEGGVA